MVTIREGEVGEVTLSIVVEVEIGVGRESTGEGEDHVPSNFRHVYSGDHSQSWSLAPWKFAAIFVRAHQHQHQRHIPA